MTTSRSAPRLALLLVLGAAACDGGEKTEAPLPKPGNNNTRIYDGPGGDAVVAGGPAINPQQLLDRIKPIMAALPKEAVNPDNPSTPEKIELGHMLYFDKRLSKNQDIACVTCHDLEHYGIDIREHEGLRDATSKGHRGQIGERNTPTVYNAALHFVQFWDGRAKDVEEQAKGPVLNPVEMAMKDEPSVLAVLRSIPGYEEKFAAAFPGEDPPITYDNVGRAVGAYERTLLTPARFDAFIAGDLDALKGQELRGLQLFLDVGCTQCHSGALLGGTQFQKLGTIKPWPDLHDVGRSKITASDADKFVFKVPSLRNVTQTAPYFHNGSEADLGNAVRMMAEHQTARGKLQDDEVLAIVAFLGSLEGEIPKDKIGAPALPENGPDTPGPDPS
jgi:cytochrome c peroxidase